MMNASLFHSAVLCRNGVLRCFISRAASDVGGGLSHVDDKGKASMVDVSAKRETERTAVAVASIDIGDKAFQVTRKLLQII